MPAQRTLAGPKMSHPPGIVSAGEARWGPAAHGWDPTSDHGGRLPKRDVVWGLEGNAGIPGDRVPASVSVAWPSCTLGSFPFRGQSPAGLVGCGAGLSTHTPRCPAGPVLSPGTVELQRWSGRGSAQSCRSGQGSHTGAAKDTAG